MNSTYWRSLVSFDILTPDKFYFAFLPELMLLETTDPLHFQVVLLVRLGQHRLPLFPGNTQMKTL